MELEQIKKTLDSGSGKAMKSYLISRLNELNSIENIKEKDIATQQAIEVKAQKRAYLKLKEILGEILSFEGSFKPKDPRDSYAITDNDID